MVQEINFNSVLVVTTWGDTLPVSRPLHGLGRRVRPQVTRYYGKGAQRRRTLLLRNNFGGLGRSACCACVTVSPSCSVSANSAYTDKQDRSLVLAINIPRTFSHTPVSATVNCSTEDRLLL